MIAVAPSVVLDRSPTVALEGITGAPQSAMYRTQGGTPCRETGSYDLVTWTVDWKGASFLECSETNDLKQVFGHWHKPHGPASLLDIESDYDLDKRIK
jgi:hypothetical protein